LETIKKHISALKKLSGGKTYSNPLLSYVSQSLTLLEVSKEKNGKLNEGQKRIRRILLERSKSTA
jgi:hypothetical protein